MSRDRSNSPGFCFVPFLVVFAGLGGYCLYVGLTTYLAGTPIMSSAVFVYLLFGGLFIAFPSLFLLSFLSESEPLEPPEKDPWTVRTAWQTNELTEQRSWTVRPIWAFLWNALAWPGAGYVLYDALWTSADPNWAGLLILLFPAVGLGVAWGTLTESLRQWKFGRSTLIMDTMPARLGRTLQARLRTSIDFEEVPEDGVHVTLSCYQQYTDSDAEGGSNVIRNLKWRDEALFSGQPIPGRPDATNVPISFDVPADLPPSTPNETKERMLWEIEASAALPGLDYNATFEIPVFEPDSSSSPSSATTDASSSSQHSDQQSSLPDHHSNVTTPVSDGIQVEGDPDRGLTISFAPARRMKPALFLTAIALPCLVGGLFLVPESFFVSILVLLFGATFGYGAWMKWTYSSKLSAENGTLQLTKGPAGNVSSNQFPCSTLKDVVVDTEGESFGTANYSLTLLLSRSGSTQKVEIVDDLAHKPDAEALATQIREAAERQNQ
jgi:hypothetical protein